MCILQMTQVNDTLVSHYCAVILLSVILITSPLNTPLNYTICQYADVYKRMKLIETGA